MHIGTVQKVYQFLTACGKFRIWETLKPPSRMTEGQLYTKQFAFIVNMTVFLQVLNNKFYKYWEQILDK